MDGAAEETAWGEMRKVAPALARLWESALTFTNIDGNRLATKSRTITRQSSWAEKNIWGREGYKKRKEKAVTHCLAPRLTGHVFNKPFLKAATHHQRHSGKWPQYMRTWTQHQIWTWFLFRHSPHIYIGRWKYKCSSYILPLSYFLLYGHLPSTICLHLFQPSWLSFDNKITSISKLIRWNELHPLLANVMHVKSRHT